MEHRTYGQATHGSGSEEVKKVAQCDSRLPVDSKVMQSPHSENLGQSR